METENTPHTSTEETPQAPTVENQEKTESLENLENLESLETLGNLENLETLGNLENLESLENLEIPAPLASPENHEKVDWQLPMRPDDISEEDYQAASKLVSAIESELSTGTISGETLAQLLKSAAYDRAVATAHHEGEVAGRNQRIDEYMQKRRREKDLPDLGRSPVQPRPTLPYTAIGGLSAADRKSIWERGNEKRHRKG